MATLDEAKEILRTLGLPKQQQNDRSAKVLLALCALKPGDPWSAAVREKRTITLDIMQFIADEWGKTYAANSRETIRRQSLHQFVQARIADLNPFEPGLATNSKDTHYAMTNDALIAIHTYGTAAWATTSAAFIASVGSLTEVYAKKRDLQRIPVQLPDGSTLRLSPGKHNDVQKGIIEEFASRFAPGARLLYLGDTAKKDLYLDIDGFKHLNIEITEHDKLPDIVLYDVERNWLFLIEAVTSHGPVSPKRVLEIQKMLKNCVAGPVYVSAFPDLKAFKKWISHIAWETEVWVAETPDHMIHYNGDRFLGPRSS